MLHDAKAAHAQEKEKREAAEKKASEAQQRLSAALVATEEATAARVAASTEAERARDAEMEARAALKRECNRSDAYMYISSTCTPIMRNGRGPACIERLQAKAQYFREGCNLMCK